MVLFRRSRCATKTSQHRNPKVWSVVKVNKIVVCDDDPSFATATAHLLFVGLDTLAKSDERFEKFEVRVLGKTDGWSTFVLDFYGECSNFKKFRPLFDARNIAYVISYTGFSSKKLRLAGLKKHLASVLMLRSLLPTDPSQYSEEKTLEERQLVLADCVHYFLELLQRTI